MNGEDQRRALMRASVRHVPFDGWSECALRAGAKDIDIPVESPRPCFRRAAKTWWSCIAVRPTRRRSTPLQHEIWCQCACGNAWRQPSGRGLKSAPRTEKPFGGPCRCLRCPETPPGARLLYGSVDTIWRAAGDRSTDWNFYSKRGLLAGVYGSTVLFWLQDNSEDFTETWAFLDRRIADVMKVPKAAMRIGKVLEPLRRRAFRPQIIRP